MATTSATPVTSTSGPIYIDTQCEDLVHDAQMDFYGAKLAVCSSDRTIKIYDVSDNSYELSATLHGHEGPVWQVSWAHPKFGVLLASCSFDGSVWIHRESRPHEWTTLHAARHLHESSVNGVTFSPPEFGLQVAAASSDGRVSILTHQPDHSWAVEYLQDCAMGVNAVSWAPYGAYYNVQEPSALEAPRLVTAGCDNYIRFWIMQDNVWSEEKCSKTFETLQHTDWVRDVAWAPCLLPNTNLVASCSEDGTVLLWQQVAPGEDWTALLLHKFDAPVWRVSWSTTGHLLAVSAGDSDVTLWRRGLDDVWVQVGKVEDEPQQT